MMKNIYLLLIAIAFISLTGCEDNEATYNGPSIVNFITETGDFFVQDIANPTFEIAIGVTTTSSVDRTFTISSVAESSDAVEGVDYTLPSTTVTIPANEYSATFTVTGIFANATTEGKTVTFEISSAEGAEIGGYKEYFHLTLSPLCPLVIDDFVGDFLIDEAGYAIYATTLTKDPNIENRIWLSNFWDWTNDLVYFDFNEDGTITMPPQNVLMGDGDTYNCSGSGTYNACTRNFHMEYNGDVAGTIHDIYPAP